MIYPNGLFMAKVNKKGNDARDQILTYTKYYYIGSERVAAKVGHITNLGHYPKKLLETAMSMLPKTNVKNASEARVTAVQGAIGKIYMAFDLPQPSFSPVATLDLMDTAYVYKVEAYRHYSIHGDHLGSSSYVTDPTGVACQHIEYLPFGETLVDEHLNSINSPYKYNGKEYDAETGNYYYGARCYDPKWSVWTSVDPLAEHAPHKSAYHYCSNNPINRTDPTGMCDDPNCTHNGIIRAWDSVGRFFGLWGYSKTNKYSKR